MLAARFLRHACRCSFFQKSFFIQCRIASYVRHKPTEVRL